MASQAEKPQGSALHWTDRAARRATRRDGRKPWMTRSTTPQAKTRPRLQQDHPRHQRHTLGRPRAIRPAADQAPTAAPSGGAAVPRNCMASRLGIKEPSLDVSGTNRIVAGPDQSGPAPQPWITATASSTSPVAIDGTGNNQNASSPGRSHEGGISMRRKPGGPHTPWQQRS